MIDELRLAVWVGVDGVVAFSLVPAQRRQESSRFAWEALQIECQSALKRSGLIAETDPQKGDRR